MIIYESMIALPNQSPNPHYLERYSKIVQIFVDRNLKKQHGFHSHHIVPKALGGSESKENIVVISPREHFILHWLLWKAFPKSGMATAFFGMCNGWGQMKSRVTSKIYEKAMHEFSERISYKLSGFTHSEATRQKHRESMLSKTAAGLNPNSKRTDGTSLASDRVAAGAFISPLSKREDGTSVASDRIKKECPHCHKMVDPGNYARYHDDRCRKNPNNTHSNKKECLHCHEWFAPNMLARWHEDKCKRIL